MGEAAEEIQARGDVPPRRTLPSLYLFPRRSRTVPAPSLDLVAHPGRALAARCSVHVALAVSAVRTPDFVCVALGRRHRPRLHAPASLSPRTTPCAPHRARDRGRPSSSESSTAPWHVSVSPCRPQARRRHLCSVAADHALHGCPRTCTPRARSTAYSSIRKSPLGPPPLRAYHVQRAPPVRFDALMPWAEQDRPYPCIGHPKSPPRPPRTLMQRASCSWDPARRARPRRAPHGGYPPTRRRARASAASPLPWSARPLPLSCLAAVWPKYIFVSAQDFTHVEHTVRRV